MGNKITVRTTIDADAKKVWDAYTHPDHITRWNFADPSWHCPSAENDLRVGGLYKARMEAKDGSFGFDFAATYKAIDPGKSFRYIMDDGREVLVTVTGLGQQTDLEIVFDAETQNSEELQKNGWQAILDNFKRYVEAV